MSTTTVTGAERQLAQVVHDLARLRMGGPRVDDEHAAVAQHDPDVLVEEGIAAHEDAIADLDPLHDVDDGSRRRSRALSIDNLLSSH